MKASHTYLSNGTKASVLNASGVGYDYNGSFTYSHSANGSRTLESVAFSGGRIRKSGSSYTVDYYVTDHLGSVRAIVNASGSVVEQNDYYPFGARHANGLSTLSGNRWRFSGKEGYDSAFGIAYDDFGARLYDRTAWTAIDPLAEKYYGISTYSYCAGNPVNRIDPSGMDNYRYDDKTGLFHLMESTDDDTDNVLAYHFNEQTGEYEKNDKWYQVRTRLVGIGKGILKDGLNIFHDNYFSISDDKLTVSEMEDFLLGLSNMVDKEIGGYYISLYNNGSITYVTMSGIANNTSTHVNPGNAFRAFKGLEGFDISSYTVSVNYHTHLSRFPESSRLKPSDYGNGKGDVWFKNRQLTHNPQMKFLIITSPASFYY